MISDDEECQGYVTCVLSFTYMLGLRDGGIGFRLNVSCSVLICMASHSRKL